MSRNPTTLKCKSEGGDFKLENKVKRQKLLAPKGPITSEKWQTVNRALDDFDEVYGAISDLISIKDENGVHTFDFSEEIFVWRAVLRSSKMISEENVSSVPRNIHGMPLSTDLVDLPDKLKKARKDFFRQIEKGTKIEQAKCEPLKVTDAELQLQLATFYAKD